MADLMLFCLPPAKGKNGVVLVLSIRIFALQ